MRGWDWHRHASAARAREATGGARPGDSATVRTVHVRTSVVGDGSLLPMRKLFEPPVDTYLVDNPTPTADRAPDHLAAGTRPQLRDDLEAAPR